MIVGTAGLRSANGRVRRWLVLIERSSRSSAARGGRLAYVARRRQRGDERLVVFDSGGAAHSSRSGTGAAVEDGSVSTSAVRIADASV